MGFSQSYNNEMVRNLRVFFKKKNFYNSLSPKCSALATILEKVLVDRDLFFHHNIRAIRRRIFTLNCRQGSNSASPMTPSQSLHLYHFFMFHQFLNEKRHPKVSGDIIQNISPMLICSSIA